MDESEQNNKKALITALAILVVVVVIVGGLAMSGKKKTDADDQTASAPTQSQAASEPSASSSASTSSSATYKDGTYKASASYGSPAGNQDISFSVTLAGGKITDTSATVGANDGTAKEYQQMFISGYKSLIVGKDIGSVNLSRVSGSSLTSSGFNDAITQIKKQAQA